MKESQMLSNYKHSITPLKLPNKKFMYISARLPDTNKGSQVHRKAIASSNNVQISIQNNFKAALLPIARDYHHCYICMDMYLCKCQGQVVHQDCIMKQIQAHQTIDSYHCDICDQFYQVKYENKYTRFPNLWIYVLLVLFLLLVLLALIAVAVNLRDSPNTVILTIVFIVIDILFIGIALHHLQLKVTLINWCLLNRKEQLDYDINLQKIRTILNAMRLKNARYKTVASSCPFE